MPDEPMVSYPLTDMLRRIDDKIDKLFTLLSSKADQSAVDRLAQRVDAHDEHLRGLLDEQSRHREAKKSHREWQYWLWPTLAAVISAGAMLIAVFK